VFILLFLPAVLGAYYLSAERPVLREAILILASLLFYAWWDARFVPLLVGQTIATWLIAEAYLRFPSRAWIVFGIAANLAVLAFFQISRLPRRRRGGLGRRAGARLGFDPAARHQLLHVRVDLLSGRSQAGRLAALPVAQILPVQIFAEAHSPAFGDAWLGALAFTFQLFLDFSAYSEMAIGLGLMLGFQFPDNFNVPYRATSIREFWRRWHTTLSRFLRDYLYIPLGGSRNGFATYVKATLITMGLCGLSSARRHPGNARAR
jgi:alginate O-acetyltransferase complex protein AlgI